MEPALAEPAEPMTAQTAAQQTTDQATEGTATGTAEVMTELLSDLYALVPMLVRHQSVGLAQRRLTQPRIRLLVALDHGGPLIMTELAMLLDVTPRAVTTLVDGLEGAGLIKRSDHPSDRRATVVELSRRGRDTCKAIRTAHHAFAHDLMGDCDPNDLAATVRVLDRIRAAVERRRETKLG
jgi:DNA-binding MarR family transcriptional regulator